MTLVSGSRVGPYEIVGSLGAGGMGEVYRARDGRLQRDVAIKILPPALAADPVHVERFQREARAIAALSHPNIVTIYSVEQVDEVHFLTMELVDGRALDHERPANGYPLSTLLEIGMSLADALAAAHERGIVHRDLKPANVMVDRHGRVKVLDFGLAKDTALDAVAQAETRAPLTQRGLIVGTMPYMAPEQIEGRQVDARTDIFALGIVLYELATGERPFAGESSAMLMTAILRDEPPPIGQRRPDLPGTFGRLIARCLEKSPNDRIQTARDVFNELRALQRETASATPLPAALHVGGVARRDPGSGTGQSDMWMAVLPFTSRGDEHSAALAEGLTEEIAAGLTRFQYLKVAATRERARYHLEGSVRRLGATIRIAAELKDVQAGVQLWGEKYDRNAGGDLFAIQDDVAARVIANVGDDNGVLVATMVALLRERPLEQLTTFELGVRVTDYLRHPRPDEHERLQHAFESRTATDPGDANAWAGAALMRLSAFIYGTHAGTERVIEALKRAERAVELDPAAQSGWYVIAAVEFFRHDLDGFRAAADRAIAINPLNTTLVAFLSHFIAYSGDWERGLALLQRVIDLNTQHPGIFFFMPFHDLYRRGEYERAAQMLKRANMPGDAWMLLNTVPACVRVERWSEARAALDTMRRLGLPQVDPHVARAQWSKFIWDDELVGRLTADFERALEDRPPAEAASPKTDVRPPSGAGRSSSSIAVLPFANLSADQENEYFGDGLAEDILNALTAVQGLNVIARTSAFAFRGKSDDVRKIGDALGVSTVLEGSVRRSGGRIRVTAQLVDTTSGTHLWSDRYDRDITDIFAVQDEIAQSIVGTLKVTLTGAPSAIPQLANVEAYDAYLKGRHHLMTLTYAGVETAQRLFERAIAADAGYAPAHADLAGCFVHYTEQGRKSPHEAMPHARELARRAIALDPSSPDGHHWLARVAAEYDYDWPAALHHQELATRSGRLAPGARGALAQFVLLPLGRYDEAQRETEAAVAADPLSSLPRIHLANVYRARGAVDRALSTMELVEGYIRLMSRGLSYSALGRIEEAIESFEGALARPMAVPFIALGELAGNLARAGQDARARETLARLDAPEHSLTRAIGHACYHVAAEQFEQAVEWLLEAAAERSPWAPAMMILHPRFRESPPVRRLFEALRIPQEYW